MLLQGKTLGLPMIMGTNENEGTLFLNNTNLMKNDTGKRSK